MRENLEELSSRVLYHTIWASHSCMVFSIDVVAKQVFCVFKTTHLLFISFYIWGILQPLFYSVTSKASQTGSLVFSKVGRFLFEQGSIEFNRLEPFNRCQLKCHLEQRSICSPTLHVIDLRIQTKKTSFHSVSRKKTLKTPHDSYP